MRQFDYGPVLFLALIASVAGLAAATSRVPDLSTAKPPGFSEQAWLGRLDQELGPVMGRCVWADVSVRMEPAHLDPVLHRANGDHRLYPRLNDMVENAKVRCRRSTTVMEAGTMETGR